MRVLLTRPPRRDSRDAGLSVPPLGLAYVAAALRESGHQVDILDAYALGWGWDRYADALAQRRPDVIGLSAMTPVADVAARAARIARPYARWIVLGGPHPTATEHAVLDEMPQLDAAVSGEGERVTPLLLAWLENGADGPPPQGVIARGHPLVEATPEADLTTLAEPARDLLPMRAYRYLFATRPGFGTMITSRGCPFRCSFCDKSVGGSQWRARPPIHVVDEMERLVYDHGVQFINFYDDNFTLKSSRVVGICEEIIRRKLDVEWKCEGRVDAVNLELLTLMRKAGCRTVAYGVESGNAETLRLLRKDVSLDDAPAAFAATRAAGIRSLAYIILGAPGEDREDVRRTIRFCHEIGADYVQFSTLTAFPGTPLFQAGQVGADVRNPVDGDLHRATLTDLPPAELQALLREAWTGFYLRPRPMARLLRDAVASGAISEAWRLGAAWGRWAVPA